MAEHEYQHIILYSHCPFAYRLAVVDKVAPDTLVDNLMVRLCEDNLVRFCTQQPAISQTEFDRYMCYPLRLRDRSAPSRKEILQEATARLTAWAKEVGLSPVHIVYRLKVGADMIWTPIRLQTREGRGLIVQPVLRIPSAAWHAQALEVTIPATTQPIVMLSINGHSGDMETHDSEPHIRESLRTRLLVGDILDAIQRGAFPHTPYTNPYCHPRLCGYWRVCHEGMSKECHV
jgi:hypothetical protein